MITKPAQLIHRVSRFSKIFLLAVSLLWINQAVAISLQENPKLQAVADQLVAQDIYTQSQLQKIFSKANFKQSILDAMQNPAEYKLTWGKYRKIFLKDERIQQGVDFWIHYAEQFALAEETYGVPASVIAAIIGVESKFGKHKGAHNVLDSLVTLVVGFERRSKFFADELRQFLILTKENNLSANEIMGSYAGAMGYPQFIASSFRSFAVDFSGDGIIDLIDQPIDAIGSIGNYLAKNGWLANKPISSISYQSVPAPVADLASRKRLVQHTATSLRALGVTLKESVNGTEKLGVVMLNASEIVPDEEDANMHIVRAGDTACEIAEQYQVPCRTLFELNKLGNKGKIFRGQRLKIPARSKPQQRSNNSNSSGKWEIKADQDKPGAKPHFMPVYFFTHQNFYVITRYNQSVLYAMAVHDLSLAIAKARQQRLTSTLDE